MLIDEPAGNQAFAGGGCARNNHRAGSWQQCFGKQSVPKLLADIVDRKKRVVFEIRGRTSAPNRFQTSRLADFSGGVVFVENSTTPFRSRRNAPACALETTGGHQASFFNALVGILV